MTSPNLTASASLNGIFDEAGRYLAPAAVILQDRPLGPWDLNGAAPRAVYAFHQPGFTPDDPGFSMFHILGGPSDKSTVSAGTLLELGIALPEAA